MVPIPQGTETYLFNALIRNGNTVAPGTLCAGCQTPVVLTFSHADLEQQDPDGPAGPLQPDNFVVVYRSAQELSAPELPPDYAMVVWQRSSEYVPCQLPTPTRDRTWGSIKSIYR
jgi:hypothetical protein